MKDSPIKRAFAQANKLWEQSMAARPPRERALIVWGGAAGIVIVLVFAVWLPLQESRTRLARSVALERQHLAVMQAVKREMQSLSAPVDLPARGPALRSAIESSARSQLSPALLEVRMEGDSGVAVKLSKVRLSKLLSWIDATATGQRIRLDYAALRIESATLTGELRFVVPEP